MSNSTKARKRRSHDALGKPPLLSAASRTERRATPPPRRVRLLLAVLLAIIAVGFAVFRWTAPVRAERFLKTASLQELQDATRSNPDDPRPFYYLGQRWMQLGQPVPAKGAFRRAADLDGDDEKSWMGAAIATAASGEIPDGLGIAIAFSQRHSQDIGSHLTIAQICAQQGSVQHASQEAVTATRLDPHSGDAWRLAGEEEVRLGALSEAERDLRQAVALDARDWRSQVALGALLSQAGHADQSAAYFTAATRLAPMEALPPLLLGKQLLHDARTGSEIEKARQYLLQSSQIQASNAEVNHQLGVCELRLGHLQTARDDLQRAQRLAPADRGIVSDLIVVDRQLHHKRALDLDTRRQRQLAAYETDKQRLTDKIKSGVHNPPSILALARLCAKNGDAFAADQYYRLLLRLAPNLQMVRPELAAVQDQEAQEALLPVLSPEPTVLSSDETPAPILLRDASALLAQGHTDEAQTAYLSILTRNAGLTAACMGMARVMDTEGNDDQAVSYYEKAAKLAPKLWQAQFALASHASDSGLFDQAAQRYRQGLAVVPRNAGAWHSLGLTLAHNSDLYQEAEDAFNRAVALQPENAVFVRDLAELQAKRQKMDAAESNFRRALALAPQDPDTQSRLAAFLIENRPGPATLQEAASLLESASASAPGNTTLAYWRGRLALQQGDARKAVPLLLRALPYVHETDAVDTWYSLSRAYTALGDQHHSSAALARADRTRARDELIAAILNQLPADPENTALNARLAQLYAEGGEYDAAVRQYERVQRIDPGNKSVAAALAKLQALLKAAH